MKFLATTSTMARLQRAEGVSRPALGATSALWLVGADLSVFTRIDLRAVPARHRRRAIAERARQLAPFADPAWHALDRDGEVWLWCWDASRVRAAVEAEDGPTRRWEVLPEQLFFQPVADTCLRQLGAATLLERWQGGLLVFSALLPEDAGERSLRLRAAGLAPDAEPDTAAATLRPRRWDVPEFSWRTLARDPVAGAAAAVALATLWLLFSLAELGGTRLANQRMADALARQEQELTPLLRQRERALAIATRNRALAGQLGVPDAIDVAAEFEYLAGERYQRLLQWDFSGRSIRVVLEDASPDNRAYVESITRSPWFPRVAVTPGIRPEQLTLEVTFAPDSTERPIHAGDSP